MRSETWENTCQYEYAKCRKIKMVEKNKTQQLWWGPIGGVQSNWENKELMSMFMR